MSTKTQQAAAAYAAQLDALRRQIELTEQALVTLECSESTVLNDTIGSVHHHFFELRRYTTALTAHLGRCAAWVGRT